MLSDVVGARVSLSAPSKIDATLWRRDARHTASFVATGKVSGLRALADRPGPAVATRARWRPCPSCGIRPATPRCGRSPPRRARGPRGPRPMLSSSVTVSSPPRCSRNSRKPSSTRSRPAPSRRASASSQRGSPIVPEQVRNRRGIRGAEQADLGGVARVERDPDRHCFAVAEAKIGQRLELVRGPVPEVERARGAELERIARAGDVFEVQHGAAADHFLCALALEARQASARARSARRKIRRRGCTRP